MLPNRIALYLTAVGDLAAALVPFLADFHAPEQIVGYATSVLGINAVVVTWLHGWQKYEERTDLLNADIPGLPGQPVTDPSTIPPDEGDLA